MLRRRRPLARAAMVGGVGYASYKAGQRQQVSSERESDQQARLDELEYQQAQAQAPAPAPAAPQASVGSITDELRKLGDLHRDGILTDAEFEVQKQKLLQGM